MAQLEVMDQDIAEALRPVPNLAWLTIKQVREEEWVGVLAHAQTVAHLRVAREALRACRRAVSGDRDEPRRNVRDIVDEALAQIKGE